MVYAWHFSQQDKQLRYHDNRPIVIGEKLTVDEPIQLCERGLHASRKLLAAANYAPGAYLWRVKLSGKVVHGNDKSVATERTAVWGFDATDVLNQFAREIALDTVEKYWDTKKFGEFPEIVLQWLRTGDESLRSAAWSAARSAARSAAWSAAESAAESAARSAARSAAESAAESAAWSAARSAARSAAESAAWSAAESAAEDKLVKMVMAAHKAAK